MNLDIQKNEEIKEHKNSIFKKIINMINLVENNQLEENKINDTQMLIESIAIAKNEWINANNDFNYAVDEDMVDYHTYKIKAYQAKYEYLIRIAKQMGIRHGPSLTEKQ